MPSTGREEGLRSTVSSNPAPSRADSPVAVCVCASKTDPAPPQQPPFTSISSRFLSFLPSSPLSWG